MGTKKYNRSDDNKTFFKCFDVIHSCVNMEQLEVARRFCNLYANMYGDVSEIGHVFVVKETLMRHKS